MNEKFKYVEYAKLSDAVRDFENDVPVFVSDCSIYTNKNDDIWSPLDRQDLQIFDQERKYAKRVEIKEVMVEDGELVDTHIDRIVLGLGYGSGTLTRYYKLVKLTGNTTE